MVSSYRSLHFAYFAYLCFPILMPKRHLFKYVWSVESISQAFQHPFSKALEAAMANVSKFKPLTADLAVCAMPLIRRPPVEFRRKFPGELGDCWSGTCIRVLDRYISFLSINLSIYLSIDQSRDMLLENVCTWRPPMSSENALCHIHVQIYIQKKRYVYIYVCVCNYIYLYIHARKYIVYHYITKFF